MRARKVAIIGAGIGGLAAAIDLSGDLSGLDLDITVYERAAASGGKARAVRVGNTAIDSGPTVLTMKRVFEDLFAAAGSSLADHVALLPLSTIARHAWSDREQLDLFADLEATVDAIASFAGPAEAARYREFQKTAQTVCEALTRSYIEAAQPTPASMVYNTPLADLPLLLGIKPYASLWRYLTRQFTDPRLRQLFARYATYCGSSPFAAPATLMLISHVEQQGVWTVEGGLYRLVEALERLARDRGVAFVHNAPVAEVVIEQGRARGLRLQSGERVDADIVICNADVAALQSGLFGPAARAAAIPAGRAERSLSALTWSLLAPASGFALARHNVFFGRDYEGEFRELFKQRRLPSDPTVYVCAQDRGASGQAPPNAAGAATPERLFILVNAPATADTAPPTQEEIARCMDQTFEALERCGLKVDRRSAACHATGPAEFDRMFPARGGALYGPASHGWMASFQRPGPRSRIQGLYLAGGSTHPGPGLPMAAISGRHAAAAVRSDLISMRRYLPAGTAGGISMH